MITLRLDRLLSEIEVILNNVKSQKESNHQFYEGAVAGINLIYTELNKLNDTRETENNQPDGAKENNEAN